MWVKTASGNVSNDLNRVFSSFSSLNNMSDCLDDVHMFLCFCVRDVLPVCCHLMKKKKLRVFHIKNRVDPNEPMLSLFFQAKGAWGERDGIIEIASRPPNHNEPPTLAPY